MVESVTSAVIEKALDAVLRKVSEGKKLSTEDLVVLMLGLFREIRNEIAEVRKEITETNKRIDALYDLVGKNYEALSMRIEETSKRIDAINDSLNKRIDEVNRRIDEVSKAVSEMRESINRRIDTLYELMGKIYETLIKQATAQKQEMGKSQT